MSADHNRMSTIQSRTADKKAKNRVAWKNSRHFATNIDLKISMKRFAYPGAILVPIAVPCFCTLCTVCPGRLCMLVFRLCAECLFVKSSKTGTRWYVLERIKFIQKVGGVFDVWWKFRSLRVQMVINKFWHSVCRVIISRYNRASRVFVVCGFLCWCRIVMGGVL